MADEKEPSTPPAPPEVEAPLEASPTPRTRQLPEYDRTAHAVTRFFKGYVSEPIRQAATGVGGGRFMMLGFRVQAEPARAADTATAVSAHLVVDAEVVGFGGPTEGRLLASGGRLQLWLSAAEVTDPTMRALAVDADGQAVWSGEPSDPGGSLVCFTWDWARDDPPVEIALRVAL